MQKKHSIAIIITIALLLSISIATVSYAWLGLDQNTIVTHISGKLVTEYFHCGSGTESDPFVITRPIHYYHMVEFFQRLTNLPVVIYSESDQTIVKFGDEYLYFQIGCPEEQLYDPSLRPETDENTEYYVFAYDSFGLLETETYNGHDRGKKSQNLNMAYYSGELSIMPIGSSSVPFVGQLDGKGLTVSNLSIVTTSTVDVHTYDAMGNVTGTTKNVERKTCDVGIFGYIGSSGFPHGADTTDDANLENSAVKNLYFNNVTIDLASLDVSAITSEVSGQEHKNTEDIHNDSVCYAGYIAGHITLSSLVQDVYVNNATFIGGSAASIGFGYFGCVEDTNGAPVTTLGSEVTTLRAKGDDAGFGGSIDMHKTYQRLQSIFNESSRGQYVTAETIIVDQVQHTSTLEANSQLKQQVGFYTNTQISYYYTSYPQGGSFNFPNDNNTSEDGTGNIYQCLYGESTLFTKTVTTYTLLKDSTDSSQYSKINGIIIFDGTNYLKKQNATAVENGAEGTANVWIAENGHFYTQDVTYTDDDGNRYVLTTATKYYLNASANGSLSLSTTAGTATVWTHDDNANTITCSISGRTWYLVYDNGWKVNPFGTSFNLSNGTVFLGQNTAANLNGTSSNYAHWILDNGKLTTFINGTFYYLNADGGNLSLGTSATTSNWVNTNGVFTYTDTNSRTWYLVYDGGWKCMPFATSFTVSYNTNYLGHSGTSVSSTASSAALHFVLESGKLLTVIDGTIYYLNASGGSLSLGPSAMTTNWVNTNGVFTYTDTAGRAWTLCYENGWKCVPFTSGFTVQSGTNFLGYNGTVVSAVGSGSALHFAQEGNDIVTSYNGSLYYLNASGGNLSLSSSRPSVVWNKTANGISYTDSDSVTWYLRYNGSNWDLFPSTTSYTIHSGANYFGLSGTDLSVTNAAGAVKWAVDGSRIFTTINGTIYYLVGSSNGSGDISLSANISDATAWTYTLGGGTMSYFAGGNTWYLYLENGEWKVYPGATVSWISQSGTYLGAASATAVGTGSSAWIISGGNISTFYNGSNRYLVSNGSAVSLSNAPSTVWTVNGDNTITNDSGWYLVYDNGWKCYPSLSYVTITDGTNYMVRNGNSIGNTTTAANATRWFADGSKLFTVDGANTYYLRGNGTALSVDTQANATDFSYDSGNNKLTYNNGDYYVIYNGNWVGSTNYATSSTIKASSGNYFLNATTTGVSTGTAAGSATQWYFDAASGRIYTVIGGVNYYLRAVLDNNNTYSSTNLTVTDNENNATSFAFASNNLTCTLNNATYTLSLGSNNLFKLVNFGNNNSLTYYTIQSQNSTGHYLSLNGTTFQDSDINGAVLWEFSSSDTPSTLTANVTTSIFTTVNGNVRYMNLTTSGLSLGNNTNLYYYYRGGYYFIHHQTGRSSRYLQYNNGWSGTTSNANNTNSGRITRGTVTYSKTALTFTSSVYQTEEQSGSITATNTISANSALNNVAFVSDTDDTVLSFPAVSETVLHAVATVNENIDQTVSAVTEKTTVSTTAATLRYMTSSTTNNVKSGNPTYFPIRVDKTDSGAWPTGYAVSPKNTGYIISGANSADTNTTSGTGINGRTYNNVAQKAFGDIRVSGFEISRISGAYVTTGLTVSRICNGGNYLTLTKDANDEYQISNTTNGDAAVYWQFSTTTSNTVGKLFTTIGKNTYYLTYNNGLTLTKSSNSAVQWTFSNNNRLAYNNNNYIRYNNGWTTGNTAQNLTLDLGNLNMDSIYTYDGTNHVLTDAQKTEVFNQAALQLAQSLNSSTRVFGLHFMDAQISMDHIIKADYVSIFNTPYTDYELPEDSIDFHVIEQGTISFFAGEYFPNNNAFFSLHQVFRYEAGDAEVIAGAKKVGDIKMIKEIAEVYKLTDKENYIYRFTDNTYTDADGGYTGSTTLASGYTSAFKTSWITAPGGMTSQGTKVYYFEIPCNAGEYCLGSVSGKTGAYLIYLDIATNGGDTIASAISSEGNDVTDSFNVEFRDAPDTVDHTILLFEIEAPAGVTEDEFSVNVTFDKTESAAPHQKGLYTINVVNKSSETLTLYVYLCDDDFILTTSFQYAYRIVYTNGDNTDTEYVSTYGSASIQAMAGFSIPPSGSVTEISY